VLGEDVASRSIVVLKHLIRCFFRASPDSPTSGIRALVRLDGAAGVYPGIGTTIECRNSYLDGDCWISSVGG
ncbi:hypothetical protein A2U01_0016826, partial [Trifolium medium]|nr:hypothetical protein [Trifolium medium]